MLVDNKDFGWEVAAVRAVTVAIQYSIFDCQPQPPLLLAAIGIVRVVGEWARIEILCCLALQMRSHLT